MQLLCLSNPDILEYLGLPKKNASSIAPTYKETGGSGLADFVLLTKQGKISAQSLSPDELVSVSDDVVYAPLKCEFHAICIDLSEHISTVFNQNIK